MGLVELFKQNPNIIINTDIDGILSGIILVKYLDCKVVGFTNSKDTVWLADGYDDLYKHVYIDMFVTSDKAVCVDQHIVAVNAFHQQKIIGSGVKYSPQIDGNRVFTDYGFKYKYPFGTFQYLIAMLQSEGVQIELPDLYSLIPDSRIKIGDLLHRADDAMKTTLYAYADNARLWWEWLKQKSGNAQVICDLIAYFDGLRSMANPDNAVGYEDRLKVLVEGIKKDTKQYFADHFGCRTSDGGYKRIVDDDGCVLENFANYVTTIGALMNCPQFRIPSNYHAHVGKYYRTRWIDLFEKEFLEDYTICGHKVFSYAFIYGPGNDSTTNLSFTVDME